MKNNYHKYTIVFFLLFAVLQLVTGQTKVEYLKGTVHSENGTPIAAATVEVVKMNIRVMTDEKGNFSIQLPVKMEYSIRVSYLGEQSQIKTVYVLKDNANRVDFVLTKDSRLLSEVKIVGQNDNQKARNEIVKAEIVDTKAAQAQAVTLVELMNRSAGVRVRQSGGLGSSTNVMLNGFQGKSIKMLKDGVPTDYLGAGYNISATPVNVLERVEVYKGVLPTEIGADALGGAINMVSKTESNRYVAVSYEIASFNTHRASLNLKHKKEGSNLFWGLDAFYNYSDNNYKVTANIPDPEKSTVIPGVVKLFHNQYRHAYVELYAGLTGLSWVDELRVGLTAFTIHRDNQFAGLMEKPFGASVAMEYTPVIPTIRYKKQFLDHKLSLDQFLAYSKIKGSQTDTLSGFYDWYGTYHAPVDVNRRGESGNPTLLTFTTSNFTSRTGLSYLLSDKQSIALNLVINDYSRTGKDPYGPTSIGEHPVDLQSLPADYMKVVTSLGWKGQFASGKIENLFQLKYYSAKTSGQEVNVNTGYLNQQTSKANTSKFGISEALKYMLSKRTYIRLSGELATRLPEQSEILGNGSYVLSNFNIKPEKSSNANLGLRTTPYDKLDIEINSFYRITKDLILSTPVNLIYAQSVNVESVKGIGFEADIRYRPWPWLVLNGNSTYQDFRLYHIKDPLMSYLEGARLRNTPYFFSNIGASLQFDDVLSKTDKIRAYYNMSYVHQYFLNYIPKNTEPDGFLGLWGKAKVDAPNIIPSQTVHSIGLLWQPKSTLPVTVNIECKNLFDAAVYDNFKIQNAGRSFHLKLNYTVKY
ncbi:TonB-dependent receptor [Sphingobacterium sp. DR205]|uniref:TonB-dependent receptor n=1 Tax=Sphingobacterium sp. DR205 TaxID=2713573 RepID=UPI0013E45CD2|nr:TonB-dependent receptor [Sphingobacterium sp. DR205]QIH34243.1 TonB-dependent receptor [Sphingobacterium sp. DR205]